MPRYAVTFSVVVYVEAKDEDAAQMAAEEAMGTLDFARDDIDADIDWECMDVTEDDNGCAECSRQHGPQHSDPIALPLMGIGGRLSALVGCVRVVLPS